MLKGKPLFMTIATFPLQTKLKNITRHKIYNLYSKFYTNYLPLRKYNMRSRNRFPPGS